MQATTLLEVMEDRYDKSSSILISQLPVKKWYGLIENLSLIHISEPTRRP